VRRGTFQQAVDLERGHAARSPSYSLALAELVEAQLAQRKLEQAATNADTLLAADPRNPMARYVKAAVEVEQKAWRVRSGASRA